MTEFICDASSKPGEIILGGDLTVENAAAIKNAVLDAIKRHDSVVIDIDRNSRADASFFQIICSAHLKALNDNKRLSVLNIFDQPLAGLVEAAGFVRAKGCSHDKNGNCIWTGGKNE